VAAGDPPARVLRARFEGSSAWHFHKTCAFMFSAVLTGLAISGWWYSEILYDHTVIYFFYAHTHKVSTLLP
jgi:hypothetical protein